MNKTIEDIMIEEVKTFTKLEFLAFMDKFKPDSRGTKVNRMSSVNIGGF